MLNKVSIEAFSSQSWWSSLDQTNSPENINYKLYTKYFKATI